MPNVKNARTRRRAVHQRRLRRQRMLKWLIPAAVAVAIAAVLLIALPPRRPVADVPQYTLVPEATATVAASPVPTQAPSPTPTAAPTLTPQPTPAGMPRAISFYHPKDKPYSPRIRFGDNWSAKWKKGKDIGSFEVIASDADELPGDFFGDIFGAAWTAFADSDKCHIGYTLRYTLDDESEIRYTMLSPQHVQHTEYIECWLYDDYHRKPHQSYSHIKKMKSDTLMTSIKLTCGSQIEHVREIWLTAFICASLDEFDAERNYTGDISCTLHITRE